MRCNAKDSVGYFCKDVSCTDRPDQAHPADLPAEVPAKPVTYMRSNYKLAEVVQAIENLSDDCPALAARLLEVIAATPMRELMN